MCNEYSKDENGKLDRLYDHFRVLVQQISKLTEKVNKLYQENTLKIECFNELVMDVKVIKDLAVPLIKERGDPRHWWLLDIDTKQKDEAILELIKDDQLKKMWQNCCDYYNGSCYYCHEDNSK